MRRRHGARIILLLPDRRFLLFRFHYQDGPLAGMNYWGVPGGGVEAGETFALAAVRELEEETGLRVDSVGREVAEGGYDFRLSTGEVVWQVDHYFVVRLPVEPALSRTGYTVEEAKNLVEHRWWTAAELRTTGEHIVPGDLASILDRLNQ